MINNNTNFEYDKYHRKKPIKEFDLNQTMYSLVTDECQDDLSLKAIGFMGNDMSYNELITSSDKLAQAFHNIGIKDGDNVAILTINMPIVQQSLLSLSKIGVSMSWIDLRTKVGNLIKYLNNSNCKAIIVLEDMLPLIEVIIDETNIKKVIVSSPKDYLSPIVKVLNTLKDKKDTKKTVLPDDSRFIRFNDFIKNIDTNNLITPAPFDKDRPSLIIPSSSKKQIVHTEYNFNSAVQKMAYTDMPFYKGNTMHVSIPPFITYGLGNSIYASMAFTMKAEMSPFINENAVYNDLGKFDISLATPLHYKYIYEQLTKLDKRITELEKDNSLEAKKELKQKMKELRRVLTGIDRAKVFVSIEGKVDADELIKMQKTLNNIIVNSHNNNKGFKNPMHTNKTNSIKIPMKDHEVKVEKPGTKKILSQRKTEKLYPTSDNLFVEYLNNSDEKNKAKITDGLSTQWVTSENICYIDKDGYFVPKGKNKSLIKKRSI